MRYTRTVTTAYMSVAGESIHDFRYLLALLCNVIKENQLLPLYKNSIIYVSPEIQYTISLLYPSSG
jgi:hypothetical protein